MTKVDTNIRNYPGRLHAGTVLEAIENKLGQKSSPIILQSR